MCLSLIGFVGRNLLRFMWYIWQMVAVLLIAAYLSILLEQLIPLQQPILQQDDSHYPEITATDISRPNLFETTSSMSLDSRPELQDMLILKCGNKSLAIIETVSAKCKKFGIMLGLPFPVVNTEWYVPGAHPELKCQSIVERWLEGKGNKPVKWKIIIEALHIVYPILVDDLNICIK